MYLDIHAEIASESPLEYGLNVTLTIFFKRKTLYLNDIIYIYIHHINKKKETEKIYTFTK